MIIETYKGIDIREDNIKGNGWLYCVTNPNYEIENRNSKVIYGSGLDIVKRKIDKFLLKEESKILIPPRTA